MLYLNRSTIGDIDLAQINCTSLVALDIYVEGTRKGSEGGDGRREGVMPLLPVKRLLRSNHQLRTLSWNGIGNPAPLLDVDDFAGLVGLKSLSVDNWDGSNGRLGLVLRKVAGTLKELVIGRKYNVETFLDCEEFMLNRLESLIWSDCERGDGDKTLSELLKRSPRLKTLVSFAKHSDIGLQRLTKTLGTSCPDFESLVLHKYLPILELETLIRYHSPGRPQLRKLHFAVQSLEDGGHHGLVAAILRHAPTLEDVHIDRTNHGKDASVCLRLLTECPRLTRFSFAARLPPFDLDFLETLKQQNQQQQQATWKCRETLQELRLDPGTFYLNRRQTDAERQEKAEILTEMGWEIVNKDEEDDEPIDGAMMKEALEMVCLQRLEGLQLLILDQIDFRRVPL
ncbi:hypothetical protein EC957_008326 [Mortierella hygrophila]|uniref:Uncharacterized protein n=1 Tax=Mortierella hygrophila TaxID=979708 RepID=A0A9P6FC97_9FUNG|nr:hypothetical protein EC957_008326 [Mortierella hygrophila]